MWISGDSYGGMNSTMALSLCSPFRMNHNKMTAAILRSGLLFFPRPQALTRRVMPAAMASTIHP